MSDIVLFGPHRAALTGIQLPTPPPTRIYISGHEYKIGAPKSALPAIANVAKVLLNWTLVGGRIARNIFYLKTGSSFVTSDPVQMKNLADALFTRLTTAPVNAIGLITSATSLNSVTTKDAGGTTTQATSSAAPVPGNAPGNTMPPHMAVCMSWQIAESYRGGKPRWYIPGVPTGAENASGGAGITPAYATQYESTGTQFMNAVNTMTLPGGGSFTLGTVSYFTGHTVRPTPQFRTFINCVVHERLDSQRRRGGSEAIWPTVP